MELTLWIDGGSRGNPGPAAAGFVITREDGTTVLEAGQHLGIATNNVAEYEGLLRALRAAAENGATSVKIISDSQLLVRQLRGEYRVRSADLRPLYEQVMAMLKRLTRWEVRHVTREHNQRADGLVNRALDAKRDLVIANAAPHSPNVPAAEIGAQAAGASQWPRWAVRYAQQPPHPCPLSGIQNVSFRFGPDTPSGMCIFAAQAVLNSGVLNGSPAARELRCPRCGVQMQLVPTND